MTFKEKYEDGIVQEAKGGIAVINLRPFGNCERCSAKTYCKIIDGNTRSIIVKDPLGVRAGDKVRIVIKQGNVLSAFFLYYIIPFLIIISAILIGINSSTNYPNFYSILLAVGLLGFYSMIFSLVAKIRKFMSSSLPVITCVSPPIN